MTAPLAPFSSSASVSTATTACQWLIYSRVSNIRSHFTTLKEQRKNISGTSSHVCFGYWFVCGQAISAVIPFRFIGNPPALFFHELFFKYFFLGAWWIGRGFPAWTDGQDMDQCAEQKRRQEGGGLILNEITLPHTVYDSQEGSWEGRRLTRPWQAIYSVTTLLCLTAFTYKSTW